MLHTPLQVWQPGGSLLGRVHAVDHVGPDGLLPDLLHDAIGHSQVHVSFKKRAPDVLQGSRDAVLGDRLLAGQLLERACGAGVSGVLLGGMLFIFLLLGSLQGGWAEKVLLREGAGWLTCEGAGG